MRTRPGRCCSQMAMASSEEATSGDPEAHRFEPVLEFLGDRPFVFDDEDRDHRLRFGFAHISGEEVMGESLRGSWLD